MRRLLLIAAAANLLIATEPQPRRVTGTPLRTGTPLAHVTAVAELAAGRLLITSARERAVWVLDRESGAITNLGSAGAGPGEYVQPGGLYPGSNGGIQILDRGRPRVLTVTPAGALGDGRSIALPDTRMVSDLDVDQQQLDTAGHVYFVDPATRLGPRPVVTLVRYDPEARKKAPVAQLRVAERRVLPGGDGISVAVTVMLSPADGWGVAPDGRVAVVRADPYRVEWISPDGAVVQGPSIEFDRLPVTDQDRRAILATLGSGPSVGRAGGAKADASALETPFAATKPPFEPDDVMVSPDGRVWVMRTRPFGPQEVIYDIFDGRGHRVDRIQLPAGSRIVGFGRATVITRQVAADGFVLIEHKGI